MSGEGQFGLAGGDGLSRMESSSPDCSPGGVSLSWLESGGSALHSLSQMLNSCSPGGVILSWLELCSPGGVILSCESSESSEGEGVFGGVSREGMGWSLKQADS